MVNNITIKRFMLLLILSGKFALNIPGVNSSELSLGGECFYKLLFIGKICHACAEIKNILLLK